MWDIEFYEKPNGRCPVQEFLDDLNAKTELPYVDNAMAQLSEHGNNLRRPQVEFLRDHIFELRVPTRTRQVRILYFFFDGMKIILTHGLIKKRSAIPDSEIEKAIEYRKEYQNRARGMKK